MLFFIFNHPLLFAQVEKQLSQAADAAIKKRVDDNINAQIGAIEKDGEKCLNSINFYKDNHWKLAYDAIYPYQEDEYKNSMKHWSDNLIIGKQNITLYTEYILRADPLNEQILEKYCVYMADLAVLNPNPKQEIPFFTAYIKVASDKKYAYRLLASYLNNIGYLDLALQYYQKANQEDYWGYYNVGTLAFDNQQYQLCIESMEKAIQVKTENITNSYWSYGILGWAQARLGNKKNAKENFKIAEKLGGNNVKNYFIYKSEAYEQSNIECDEKSRKKWGDKYYKNLDNSKDRFKAFCGLYAMWVCNPTSADVARTGLNFFNAYPEIGWDWNAKFRKIYEGYNFYKGDINTIITSSNSDELYNFYITEGNNYLEKGEKIEAMRFYNFAVYLNNNRAEAYYYRAKVVYNWANGEDVIAWKDVENALKANPNHSLSHALKGIMYYDFKKEKTKAINEFALAEKYANETEKIELYNIYTNFYYDEKDYANTVNYAEKFLQAKPDDIDIRIKAIKAYDALGNKTKANEYHQYLIENFSTNKKVADLDDRNTSIANKRKEKIKKDEATAYQEKLDNAYYQIKKLKEKDEEEFKKAERNYKTYAKQLAKISKEWNNLWNDSWNPRSAITPHSVAGLSVYARAEYNNVYSKLVYVMMDLSDHIKYTIGELQKMQSMFPQKEPIQTEIKSYLKLRMDDLAAIQKAWFEKKQ